MNLFAEKLMLILNLAPEGSGEKDMLMQWLKKYLGSQKQQEFGTEHLTRSEDLANRTYHSMATLILEACDNERWDQPDFQERLDSQNAALVDNLTQHVAVIEGMQDLVPAFFSTLHALYAAHEVGKTATNFCSFLQIQGKGTHQKQSETNKKVKEVAHQLLQVVTEKCATVKKGLDEGGWIDKVLESVLPDIQEASDGENTGVAPIIGTFKELMEENFMEEWAGQVVESWRDSVSGFSYIMAPSKD
jgi:N-terminal acetyltransferase B complex non-catalytic subunit